MSPRQPHDEIEEERLLERAIDWLRSEDGTESRSRPSESHEEQAFARAWAAVGTVGASPKMIALRKAALNNAARAARARQRRRLLSTGSVRWGAAAAAVLLVCFLVATVYLGASGRPQVFETAVGERRVVTLSDNSTVSLDQGSRVAVTYSRRLRDVHLLKGQAEFDVAKDVLRPFSVTVAGSRVVATGTLFNIDLLDRQLFVTLVRGGVVVDRNVEQSDPSKAILLGPSEQLVVERATGAARKTRIEPGDIEAWKLGKLVFEVEPLEQAVARVNRYSRRKVTLAATAQARQPISGVFNTGNIDAFTEAVSVQLPVRAVARDRNVVLVPR